MSDPATFGPALTEWILDTDGISAMMRQEPLAIVWLGRLPEEDKLYASVISHAEILYGLDRMPLGRRRTTLQRGYEVLLARLVDLIEPSREVAEIQAKTKSALVGQGLILPDNDLWIAATAIHLDFTILTDDKHFTLIPGTRLVSWKRDPLPPPTPSA